eukprot:scaffold83610_cov59-Attheya_sp.AAC.2
MLPICSYTQNNGIPDWEFVEIHKTKPRKSGTTTGEFRSIVSRENCYCTNPTKNCSYWSLLLSQFCCSNSVDHSVVTKETEISAVVGEVNSAHGESKLCNIHSKRNTDVVEHKRIGIQDEIGLNPYMNFSVPKSRKRNGNLPSFRSRRSGIRPTTTTLVGSFVNWRGHCPQVKSTCNHAQVVDVCKQLVRPTPICHDKGGTSKKNPAVEEKEKSGIAMRPPLYGRRRQVHQKA